jgi:arylsulfatase A-like enzyme
MFDVYPTIVEAIGGEVSPGRMAKSQLPVATGKTASVRDVVISEIGTTPPLRMMARTARYKWWVEERGESLYDMEADPYEMHNLADDPAQKPVLEQMRARMLTELRTTQVNLSEGYKSKVKRLREKASKEEKGKAAESQ